jgi:hypothetical protein
MGLRLASAPVRLSPDRAELVTKPPKIFANDALQNFPLRRKPHLRKRISLRTCRYPEVWVHPFCPPDDFPSVHFCPQKSLFERCENWLAPQLKTPNCEGKTIEVERDSPTGKAPHVRFGRKLAQIAEIPYVSILDTCGFWRLIRWITGQIVGRIRC